MRSIADILNLVTDGKVPSKEDAAAIIEEEAAARVAICKITTKEARKNLRYAIGFATAMMSNQQADKVMELFNTSHPIWGRAHPTPEQAMQFGQEDAAKASNRRRTIEA